MKIPKHTFPILAIALGGLMTSCVEPYYEAAATTTTVTHYRPGHVVHTLPPRYQTETIGGVRYYRQGSTYYRPQGSRYVVVEAPRGGRGWNQRHQDGRHDPRGRFDRPGEHYGQVVRSLPRGARAVNHRGTRYYVHGGTYYRPQGRSYVIVRSPF